MELGIKGKRAVVTGAGQGIGRETALVLAQEGAVVCVSDINDSRGKETVEEICERGGTGIYIHADVGVPEEIKHLFRTAAERLGSVDILINNAAISPKVPFEDIPLEQLEQVLRVNLMGAFLCAQEAAAQMKEKRWGRIISLASMAGRFGANKSGAHYAATKAGIVGMTLSLAKTLGPYNITVNCVSPGRINTELTRVLPQKVQNEICSQIPLGRIGEPSEVASVIAFLASEQASYVSGPCVDVLGGYIA